MMTIWEKLARCSSPGEIQRMVRGTNFELVEKAEIEGLRVALKEIEDAAKGSWVAKRARAALSVIASTLEGKRE